MFVDGWVGEVDPLLPALYLRALEAAKLEFVGNSFPFF